MIFLTVGTQFPFDRLVQAVDRACEDGLIDEEVFAQIGDRTFKPRNFEWVDSLEKEVFDENFKKASAIIGHAGMGTIAMALANLKPLLVMPRLKKFGEVVNDHQIDIARKFEELGHLLVAYDDGAVPSGIRKLKSFLPQKRKANPHTVAKRIVFFLNSLSESR